MKTSHCIGAGLIILMGVLFSQEGQSETRERLSPELAEQHLTLTHAEDPNISAFKMFRVWRHKGDIELEFDISVDEEGHVVAVDLISSNPEGLLDDAYAEAIAASRYTWNQGSEPRPITFREHIILEVSKEKTN